MTARRLCALLGCARLGVCSSGVCASGAQAAENATASRREPNLMDTGFTYMYYPAPSNFTNAAITGGPIHGGTSVVIDGSGFTRGYRSEADIDVRRHDPNRARAHAQPGSHACSRSHSDPASPSRRSTT